MALFNWITFRLGGGGPPRLNGAERKEPGRATSYKWVPVIARDYCTGCGQCIKACEHECLEMVWEFATLQRPKDCGSEGNCQAACPEGIIEMQWVAMVGNPDAGRWRSDADAVPNSITTVPGLQIDHATKSA